jgi:hypothetical protein
LFNKFKTWFFGQDPLGVTNTNEGVREMTATITPVTGNKFALVTRTGEVVSTYARARDAKRGAARRGLVVA